MRLRKDVNAYLFDPTRKYFHVIIELENVPGALRDILGVMQGLNLNILGSFSSVDSASRLGVWSCFVENGTHTVDELKRKLGASAYVHDAMVVESRDGFLVDGVHFPVAFNTGVRAVMMDAKALANMLRTVNEQFGSGGNVILYEEGRSYGREVAGKYLEKLGADFIAANMAEVLKLYQALGWFRVAKIQVDHESGRISVDAEENFECAGVSSRVPHSHFVRGHMEGMVTTWLGRPMECTETTCIAMGDRACRFELGPRRVDSP